MLKNEMEKYLSSGGKVVFPEEKAYIERKQFDVQALEEKSAAERFSDAYIERCDKESENVIAQESSSFLTQPLDYLKKNKDQFMYMESKWFDIISVDAISLEVDDVFATYDVMLGLKLQKKFEKPLKEYLNTHLHNDEAKFDLMFNGDEGLWSLNFALNYVEGFQEEMTIGQAYQLIYSFLFMLVEEMEA
jgi:hypothetical protein